MTLKVWRVKALKSHKLQYKYKNSSTECFFARYKRNGVVAVVCGHLRIDGIDGDMSEHIRAFVGGKLFTAPFTFFQNLNQTFHIISPIISPKVSHCVS